jgi:hypothetical protein
VSIKRRLLDHRRTYTVLRRMYVVGRYWLRRVHERDFEAFGNFERSGLLLDVGANSGASALSFRLQQPDSPILSIEPSSLHHGDLRLVRRIVGNMECMFCAAGEEAGVLTLHVPYYNGIPLSEFASLDPSFAGAEGWPVRAFLGDARALGSIRGAHGAHTGGKAR